MGFIEIFIQVMPYLAVFVILEYMIKIQQKRAKEREEERKKGIIREHYVIKTEKMLTAIFIVAVFLFGGGMVPIYTCIGIVGSIPFIIYKGIQLIKGLRGV